MSILKEIADKTAERMALEKKGRDVHILQNDIALCHTATRRSEMSFLLKYKVYILAALTVIFLFVCLRIYMKRRKRRKAEEEMSMLQRRNDALAEALRNPLAKEQNTDNANGPVEISWDDKAVNDSYINSGVQMMELVELSSYSRKKYVFRADRPITIGRGEDNQLVLHHDDVAEHHCVVSLRDQKPYVYSRPGARSVLRRGKKTALVSGGGVFLNNGDQLELGSTLIQFRMYNA